MQKQYIIILLACLLLLSACTISGEGIQTDSSSATNEPPTSNDVTAEGLPAEDLPINITYISGDGEVNWECTNYKHNQVSFEMPESWQTIDGAEHGLMNGVFLVPPDTDTNNFRFSAHVAIEVTGAAPNGANIPDFSSESVQKDFFASQIVYTYSKMGGLSDLEFLVWESDQFYVYMAQFKRSNDKLSMYQTTYYVMDPDRVISVNAAHFGEDAVPGVNEVARHLINTFV